MATIQTPKDFIIFLKLLIEHEVKFLLIGGYAVGFHGYVRATGDMDIWVSNENANIKKVVGAISDFGFGHISLSEKLFQNPDNIIRMGVTPLRIEVMTNISAVTFDECYGERIMQEWNGVHVPIISLEKLIKNKKASGRLKDLADVEQLEKLL